MAQHLDAAGEQTDAGDPFTLQGKHVTPMVQPVVAASTKRWVYFVVYKDKSNPERPEIHVEFKNGGQVFADQVVPLPEPDEHGAIAMFVAAATRRATANCELPPRRAISPPANKSPIAGLHSKSKFLPPAVAPCDKLRGNRMTRVACTLALAASALLAQAPAPGPLIRLYPVALDAGGQPVTDLTADDFKIVDQAKAQTILSLQKAPAAAPSKLDVLEFSNRPTGKTTHNTVILLDMINLADSDRQENWKALDKTIPQIQSGENLYFYVLNLEGTLIPIHPIGPPAADDKTWPRLCSPRSIR
ncbi:MAG: hypothetical protein WDO73_27350 [Ignavibacteriota bacterium]